MKKFKKLLALFLALSLAALSSACIWNGNALTVDPLVDGETTEASETQDGETELTDESQTSAEEETLAEEQSENATEAEEEYIELPKDFTDSGIELEPDMVPEACKGLVGDYLNIDASVRIPEEFNFYRFKAKPKDVKSNLEKIRDEFVSPNADCEYLKDDEGEEKYYYTDSDGANLSLVQQGNTWHLDYYAGGDDLYVNRDLSENHGHNSYGNFFINPQASLDPNRSEKYPYSEVKGLDKEESVALAIEKLHSLGIECEEDPEVYAITVDSPGVEEAYQEHYDFYKPFEEMYGDPVPEFTKLTAEDEAYYMIFRHSYEGMPICGETYYVGWENEGYALGNIVVVVGKNGIVELDAYSLGIEPTGERVEVKNLYNVDVIGKKLQEIYEEVLHTCHVKITEIRLEYVGVVDGGKLTFDPCWVCIGNRDIGQGYNENPDCAAYFDALTGEFIMTERLLDEFFY